MRATSRCLMLAIALFGLACSSPQLVECTDGRFVRVNEEPWCVFPSRTARCPSVLPVAHALDFGGRGCAREEFDPPPTGLCEASGLCGDAG